MYLSNKSGNTADQHQNAENDTIPAEYSEVMFLDIAHQETDDDDRYQECGDHADQQKCSLHTGSRESALHQFQQLAPNIAGIARKKVNSAAAVLETPSSSAPTMVAPEREVPGNIAAIS